MNDWYVSTNRAGKWCACHRDGTKDAQPNHNAALAVCDRRNREDADLALADLSQNSNPRDGAPNE
jgi:hypothetical protein